MNKLTSLNAAMFAAFFMIASMQAYAQGTTNPPAAAPLASAPAAPVRVLLIPARETTLVAQMVGRVDRLGGELGARFESGSAMVSLDCSEHQARLKMSLAEYAAAKEQHEAKLRLQGLQAAGEVEVQLAASAAEKARAQIDLTKAQMALCVVRAPFGGRIVKLHVKPFQGVNVGQPIMDIVSSGPLKVRLNAPSKWLTWLRVGTNFQIVIDETGRAYPAKITAMNGRVDAVSQSIEVEGLVQGTHADLLAGMSGNAKFSAAQ